jgi:hypothetical protein
MVYFSDLKQMFYTHDRANPKSFVWFDTNKEAEQYLKGE